MKINKAGIDLIKRWEGLKLKAYRCPAKVLTIGYGHTGSDVEEGMVITEDEAEALLRKDLRQFEKDVAFLIAGHTVTENQFAALVSFAYNCGSDIDDDIIPEGLGDSTLLKKLRKGDIEGASLEFLKWTRAKGVVLPGLVSRRKAERALFLSK